MSNSKVKKTQEVNTSILAKPGAYCNFCKEGDNNEVLFGKFYKLGRINCHHFCLLLSYNLSQNGQDDQGILGFLYEDIVHMLKTTKHTRCYYCGCHAPTIHCDYPHCKKVFHLPCGKRNGALNIFADRFQSYCKEHRPMQSVPVHLFLQRDMATIEKPVIKLTRVDCPPPSKKIRKIKQEIEETSVINVDELEASSAYTCAICYDDVVPYPTPRSIWPECCRKDSWLHRICVEKLALSAGQYHVRCPLCNNQPVFLDMLYRYGFYVPNQDASWELEEGAYQDLLQRPKDCFRQDCLCPKGNRFCSSKNGPWKLIVCELCGSQAIHRDCDSSKGRSVICSRCQPSPSNTQQNLNDDLEDDDQPTIQVILSDVSESEAEDKVNTAVHKPKKITLLSEVECIETNSLLQRLTNTLQEFKSQFTTESDSGVDLQSSENCSYDICSTRSEDMLGSTNNPIPTVTEYENSSENDKTIKKRLSNNGKIKKRSPKKDKKTHKKEGLENGEKIKKQKRKKVIAGKVKFNFKKPRKHVDKSRLYSRRNPLDGRYLRRDEFLAELPNGQLEVRKIISHELGIKDKTVTDQCDGNTQNVKPIIVDSNPMKKKHKKLKDKTKTDSNADKMTRINKVSINSDLVTLYDSRRKVNKKDAKSWSHEEPARGVNIVLKNGKFHVLKENANIMDVSEGSVEDKKKIKRRKKRKMIKQRSPTNIHTSIDVSMTEKGIFLSLKVKDETSPTPKKDLAKVKTSPITQKHSAKKSKLSPEKGQTNILSFFNKTNHSATEPSIKQENLEDTVIKSEPIDFANNADDFGNTTSGTEDMFTPVSVEKRKRRSKGRGLWKNGNVPCPKKCKKEIITDFKSLPANAMVELPCFNSTDLSNIFTPDASFVESNNTPMRSGGILKIKREGETIDSKKYKRVSFALIDDEQDVIKVNEVEKSDEIIEKKNRCRKKNDDAQDQVIPKKRGPKRKARDDENEDLEAPSQRKKVKLMDKPKERCRLTELNNIALQSHDFT